MSARSHSAQRWRGGSRQTSTTTSIPQRGLGRDLFSQAGVLVPRASLLDAHGSGAPPQNLLQAMANLGLVCLFWLLCGEGLAAASASASPSARARSGASALASFLLTSCAPAVLLQGVGVLAAQCAVWLACAWLSVGCAVPYDSALSHAAQHAGVGAILLGTPLALHRWARAWPFLQRLALCMNGGVMALKLWSLCEGNRELWREVKGAASASASCAAGCAGEGDYVTAVLAQAQAQAQAALALDSAAAAPRAAPPAAPPPTTTPIPSSPPPPAAAAAPPAPAPPAPTFSGPLPDGATWTLARAPWPQRVSVGAFCTHLFSPSIVYVPNVPRRSTVRIGYVLEKLALLAACFLAAVVLNERTLLPIWAGARSARSVAAFLELFLSSVVPIVIQSALIFIITWEGVTNVASECLRIADRPFYGPWWASASFSQFSVLWNMPVSNFLRRHIYEAGGASPASLVYTFLFSIMVHELFMYSAMGGHWRVPWLSLFSLAQFPLRAFPKWQGNCFFWLGLTIGLPALSLLYAADYAQ